MLNIGQIKRFIPEEARDLLKKTPIGSLYYSPYVKKIRGKRAYLEQVSFSTPAGNIVMELPEYSGLQDAAKKPAGYEPKLIEELKKVLTPEKTYYDVGAGYGYNATIALELGIPPQKIHLFEADPYRLPILKRNVSSTTKIIHQFVGDGSEDSLKLDNYSSSPPQVMTIDIEGSELNAIRGAEALLETEQPDLFIEVHPTLIPDGWPELQRTLESLEYHLRVINHRQVDATWQPADVDFEIDHSTPNPTFLVHATVN